MKIEVYSLKDTMVGFSQPFCYANDAVALRAFQASVQSTTQNQCNTFPENKELYHIGTLDDQTGLISVEKTAPRFLARASSYVLRQDELPLEKIAKEKTNGTITE